MRTPITLALLGLGILLIAGRRSEPAVSLRARAVTAQRASARASRLARELTVQWLAVEAEHARKR